MNKRTYLIISMIIIMLVLFIFSVIFSLYTISNDSIINGISIAGIDVSNLSKDDAKKLILKKCNEKISSNFTVSFKSQENPETEYSSANSFLTLNIEYNISQAIEDAYLVGRNKNIFENNFDILNTLINKKNIDLNFSLDENNLEQLIDKLKSEIPNGVIDSSYYIEDNNLIILKGFEGYLVNKDELKNSLYSLIGDISKNENNITFYLVKSSPKNINIEKIHNEIYKTAQNAYYEKEPFKVYQEVYGVDFDIESAKSINNCKFGD